MYKLARATFVAGLITTLAAVAQPAVAQTAKRLFAQNSQLRWGTTSNSVVVTLRGVNFMDPIARLPQNWNRPPGDYSRVANYWRANVIRIPIQSGEFRNRKQLTKDTAIAEINHALAASPKLFVIVDWHTIGWPDDVDACDSGFDCSFSLAREFWDWAARQWGSNGRVAFELWNEPRSRDAYDPGAGNYWRQDPANPDGPWGLRRYWTELVQVIRAAGAQNLIIAAGNRNASRLDEIKLEPLSDNNVAYAWHVYPEGDTFPAATYDARLDGLHLTKPVIITEWGWCDVGDDARCDNQGDGQPFHARATKNSYGQPLWDRYLRPSPTALPSPLSHIAWVWSSEWLPSLVLDTPYFGDATIYGTFVKQRLNSTTQVRPN